jgi:hypothetical protein
MYVDGWMLFAIYFIAVLALAVSVYALWSLEEIRLHYKRIYNQRTKMYNLANPSISKNKLKSYWKK